MDPDREEWIDDLDRFRKRKEYYRRVGKAWKRGYLLYGPGNGEIELSGCNCENLRYNVYDLDLKEVMCNSDLRRLLVGTASKSILVIEDIDSSMNLKSREDAAEVECAVNDEKVRLSVLLNLTDGLWSSCEDERIIIFTTNHRDHLDPALLRPGRMDVHIEMSYCCYSCFKVLAANYLGIGCFSGNKVLAANFLRIQKYKHPMYREIEELSSRVQVTPAVVAGELMKSDDVEVTLKDLIEFLVSKDGEQGKI